MQHSNNKRNWQQSGGTISSLVSRKEERAGGWEGEEGWRRRERAMERQRHAADVGQGDGAYARHPPHW